MNPEFFARLKEILLTLPRLPEGKRKAYVDDVCGDDHELRRHVESILSADADIPEVLKTGGVGDLLQSGLGAGTITPLADTVPDTIGPYAILGVLGEGGMGIVYRALQTEPIRREVALKLVKRGMDTDQVVARFEAERQALAMMDHPNIATVLDAGTDDQGRPYFVMELVRGVPISEYCSQNNLNVKQRLEIFLIVCRAVQHAHLKGIIHRDLKPSNIIVNVRDGAASPKIIDFGIARAIDDRTGGKTLLTQEGQLVGTPEYMSPEQALGDPRGIDLRTDVYSSGVILYELLTGQLPYDTKRTSIIDVARVIREEPPRPLQRMETAAGRIDPDVETIVLKALEKEPDRRYYSAAALGEDIERYLASQPILARPPSTVYQLKKLVARHRVLFAFVATVIVLLLAFGVTMSFMFENQRRAYARADGEARKAEQISDFLRGMLGSVAPEHRGREVTVREVLDEAADDVATGFSDQPEVRSAVQQTIGQTYQSLGMFEEAEPHLRAALATQLRLHEGPHPDRASSKYELAELLWRRGVYQQADTLSRQALEERMGFLRESEPEIVRSLLQLGTIQQYRGNYAEVESLYLRALAIVEQIEPEPQAELGLTLSGLGTLYKVLGRAAEAEPFLRRSLAVRTAVYGDTHVAVAAAHNALGSVLHDQYKIEEAEQQYRKALAMRRELLGNEHPDVATSLNNLGLLMKQTGRLAEAEQHYRESLAIVENLNPDGQFDNTTSLHNLAALLRDRGNFAEAEELQLDAIAKARRILGEEHIQVAILMRSLARLYQAQGRYDESEEAYQEALSIYDKVLDGDHPSLASCLQNFGILYKIRGRLEEAEDLYRDALEMWTRLFDENHRRVAEVLFLLGKVTMEKGEPAEAEPMFGRYVAIRRDIYKQDDWKIAWAESLRGECLTSQGRYAEAESLLVNSLPALGSPDQPSPKRKRNALERLIKLYEAWGKPGSADRYRTRLREMES